MGRRAALCAATIALVAAGVTVASGSASATGADPAAVAKHGRYVATIRRTEFGIPHILAEGYGDLGFGYGYAFAEDNICSLADETMRVDGTRSEFLGPDTDSGDQLAGPVSNLDSDLYYRSLNSSGVIERALAQPAPLGPTADLRQLVTGYVAGVNEYLARTGVANLSDPTCRAQPWVHAISDIDIYRLLYDFNQFGGTSFLKNNIAHAAPGSTAAQAARPNGLGSNGIAIGRDATQNGHGELLANPHFPWVGEAKFYQVQLTIPGRLDVTGASIYGSPVVEIGHTSSLAWTHTFSTAQRFTLYQLQLAPGDPTSYLVDGHVEAMTRRTVTVPVRTADGRRSSVTRTLYSSRYGPLLDVSWTNTAALAVKGSNADNVRSFGEWLALDSARSVPQLRAIENHYQGLPFVNTIATDSTGTAYLSDATVVPNVTDAEAARCVNSPLGKSAYPFETILDGSTSACGWGTDPTAVEPGVFGPGTNPAITRTDFVTNSNDSAWLSNPAAPVTGFPRIYGDTGTARSLRTREGLRLIQSRLAGTDGLGRPGFSLPTLQRMELGDTNMSAQLARDGLVALCRNNPVLTASDGTPVDVRAACPVLANWDLRGDQGSRGETLWREFWLATQAGNLPDMWSVPFDPAHPATTPNTLNTASAGVRRALADAVEGMRAAHTPLDAQLGTTQRTTIGGPAVSVPGCLDEEGCYNVVMHFAGSRALGDDGRFPDVDFGSSFIMTADLGPSGVTARTILTYSESTNPASAHHNDQTELFARKGWVTDRFTPAEIAADPHLTTEVVAGR